MLSSAGSGNASLALPLGAVALMRRTLSLWVFWRGYVLWTMGALCLFLFLGYSFRYDLDTAQRLQWVATSILKEQARHASQLEATNRAITTLTQEMHTVAATVSRDVAELQQYLHDISTPEQGDRARLQQWLRRLEATTALLAARLDELQQTGPKHVAPP